MASLVLRFFLLSILTCNLLTVSLGKTCKYDGDCNSDQCCASFIRGHECLDKGGPGAKCIPEGKFPQGFCPCKLQGTCKEPTSPVAFARQHATCSNPDGTVDSFIH